MFASAQQAEQRLTKKGREGERSNKHNIADTHIHIDRHTTTYTGSGSDPLRVRIRSLRRAKHDDNGTEDHAIIYVFFINHPQLHEACGLTLLLCFGIGSAQ